MSRKAKINTFEYSSRIVLAEAPSEIPKRAERQAQMTNAATTLAGQVRRHRVPPSDCGCNKAYAKANPARSRAGRKAEGTPKYW
jgi:hypothetical protein